MSGECCDGRQGSMCRMKHIDGLLVFNSSSSFSFAFYLHFLIFDYINFGEKKLAKKPEKLKSFYSLKNQSPKFTALLLMLLIWHVILFSARALLCSPNAWLMARSIPPYFRVNICSERRKWNCARTREAQAAEAKATTRTHLRGTISAIWILCAVNNMQTFWFSGGSDDTLFSLERSAAFRKFSNSGSFWN